MSAENPGTRVRARDTITWDDEKVARAIGAELRRLRLREGMTQDDVSRITGFHRPIVCRIERGRHLSTLETCARFAQACGGGLGHVLVAMDRATGALP